MTKSFTDTPKKSWLEGDFTQWLTSILTRDGAIVVPLIGEMRVSGWPDRLVYHRSWHGLLELKRYPGVLSRRQAANILKLNMRCPGHAVVLRCCGAGEGRNTAEDHTGKVLFEFCDVESLVSGLMRGTKLDEMTRRADGFESDNSLLQSRLDDVRTRYEAVIAAMEPDRGNGVWYYQGDEYDHPESLTCPVVMTAEQFRELMRIKTSYEEQQHMYKE